MDETQEFTVTLVVKVHEKDDEIPIPLVLEEEAVTASWHALRTHVGWAGIGLNRALAALDCIASRRTEEPCQSEE
jgi:hypothetical protein